MSHNDPNHHHHFTRSTPKSLIPVIVNHKNPLVEQKENNSSENIVIIPENILHSASQTIVPTTITNNNPVTNPPNIITEPHTDSDTDNNTDNEQQLGDNLEPENDSIELEDNLNNSDSDSDEDMASSGLPPPPIFGGDTSLQCPQDWLRSLQYWVAYKTLNADQIKAAIPVLLKDSALIFYQGLPAGQKDTLEHFAVPFLRHYKTDGTLPWIDLAALWSCKQTPSQSVEKYLREISKLALKAEAPPEQILQAALSGLSPQIRAHLILHQITDINDLRGKALLAEKSLLPTPPPPPSSTELNDTLASLQKQLTTLSVQSAMTDSKLDRQFNKTDGQTNRYRDGQTDRHRDGQNDRYRDRQQPNEYGNNRQSRDHSRRTNGSSSRETSRGRSPSYNRSNTQRQVSFQDQRSNRTARQQEQYEQNDNYVQPPYRVQQYRGNRQFNRTPQQQQFDSGKSFNRYANTKCYTCRRMGHTSRVCRSQQQQFSNPPQQQFFNPQQQQYFNPPQHQYF